MKSFLDDYKIAFVGWNPFQLLHVKNLLLSLPKSVFVIEKRRDNNVEFFSDRLLSDVASQIVMIDQKNMKSLDEDYDIILIQTLFYDIHKIKKAKIIMLQYGYAKEPYNYGVWRSLASLCLTYGEYASKKIETFTPTVVTGNPRYDLWHDPLFFDKAKFKYKKYIDLNKKTILYVPTWGELSSFDLYGDVILSLRVHYNLLIKMHHNSDYLELKKISKIKKIGLHYFGANDDLLELISLADIVISDYSGAIFDAFYCQKTILLLNLPSESLLKSKKIDKYSLEFSQRDNLGIQIDSPTHLLSIIQKIEQVTLTTSSHLREKLFLSTDSAVENIHKALKEFIEGKYKRNQIQGYIHQSVSECYNKKTSLEEFRKLMIEIYFIIVSFWRR